MAHGDKILIGWNGIVVFENVDEIRIISELLDVIVRTINQRRSTIPIGHRDISTIECSEESEEDGEDNPCYVRCLRGLTLRSERPNKMSVDGAGTMAMRIPVNPQKAGSAIG